MARRRTLQSNPQRIDNHLIASSTNPKTYKRGTWLLEHDRVLDPIVQGSRLMASVDDNSKDPYPAMAMLAAPNTGTSLPVLVSCGCGKGSYCEHVVALLLAWVKTPASFEVLLTAAEIFPDASRDDLLSIIDIVTSYDPDVYDLVLQTAGVLSQARQDVDADESSFNTAELVAELRAFPSDLSGDIVTAPPRMSSLLIAFRNHDQQFDTRKMLSLSAMLLDAIRELISSESGDSRVLAILVSEAMHMLSDHLLNLPLVLNAALPGDTERLRLLRMLFDYWEIYAFQLHEHEFFDNVLDTFIQGATIEEQREVLTWLKSLPSAEGWLREDVVLFRSEMIVASEGDVADFVDLYKAEGDWSNLINIYVDMGRHEEAIAVAREHMQNESTLYSLAWKVTRDRPDLEPSMVDLMEHALSTSDVNADTEPYMVPIWLSHHYRERGDREREGKVLLTWLQRASTTSVWKQLQALMQVSPVTAASWNTDRTKVHLALRERGAMRLAAFISMEEGDVESALTVLESFAPISSNELRDSELRDIDLRVADAVATTHPDVLVNIYVHRAHLQVARRTRMQYRDAASLLATVRSRLLEQGQEEAWEELISDFRKGYPTLKALQEELVREGL